MTKPERITDFLDRYVTQLPRCYGPYRYSLAQSGLWNVPRPQVEDVAKEFLGVAEFRALQLGTWLGTTDGQIITQAVESVLPMFYAEDVALLVEGLRLATAMQQREGRKNAFAVAALALVAVGLGASIRSETA